MVFGGFGGFAVVSRSRTALASWRCLSGHGNAVVVSSVFSGTLASCMQCIAVGRLELSRASGRMSRAAFVSGSPEISKVEPRNNRHV